MQGWPPTNISSKELVQCEMNVIPNQANVDLLYTSCYSKLSLSPSSFWFDLKEIVLYIQTAFARYHRGKIPNQNFFFPLKCLTLPLNVSNTAQSCLHNPLFVLYCWTVLFLHSPPRKNSLCPTKFVLLVSISTRPVAFSMLGMEGGGFSPLPIPIDCYFSVSKLYCSESPQNYLNW